MITAVFLGTPEFAVPTLNRLLNSEQIHVLSVITQPDRKSGRGQKQVPPPVKQRALEEKVPVFQCPSIRKTPEAYALLEDLKPDVCVVVAFGQILPKGFYDLAPLGTLNVHASLLPAYRGAAPIVHTLLNGETETGVTIMKIDEGMDTGPILTMEKTSVSEDTTAGELERILSETGGTLLVNTLLRYANGEIEPVGQDHESASYAPRIKKETALIDWGKQAQDIHNLIRAMNPRPGAFTRFRGHEVKIWKSKQVHEKSRDQIPGRVLEVRDEVILVACGESSLLALKELQMPNRKKVSAVDFANGNHLAKSEQFGN